MKGYRLILGTEITDQVAQDEYNKLWVVVRDALRLLKREKALEKERLEILRREIATGVAQAKRGRLSPRSVEEIASSLTGNRKE